MKKIPVVSAGKILKFLENEKDYLNKLMDENIGDFYERRYELKKAGFNIERSPLTGHVNSVYLGKIN